MLMCTYIANYQPLHPPLKIQKIRLYHANNVRCWDKNGRFSTNRQPTFVNDTGSTYIKFAIQNRTKNFNHAIVYFLTLKFGAFSRWVVKVSHHYSNNILTFSLRLKQKNLRNIHAPRHFKITYICNSIIHWGTYYVYM